jgi:very-short-patch-repair endonuclease
MRGEQPWRTSRARALRSQPISAEAKLWAKLRNRQLGGFKFVRQAPIGPYFADFLCRERKVIVEVDGGTHGARPRRRADRQPAPARLSCLPCAQRRCVREYRAPARCTIGLH